MNPVVYEMVGLDFSPLSALYVPGQQVENLPVVSRPPHFQFYKIVQIYGRAYYSMYSLQGVRK